MPNTFATDCSFTADIVTKNQLANQTEGNHKVCSQGSHEALSAIRGCLVLKEWESLR